MEDRDLRMDPRLDSIFRTIPFHLTDAELQQILSHSDRQDEEVSELLVEYREAITNGVVKASE